MRFASKIYDQGLTNANTGCIRDILCSFPKADGQRGLENDSLREVGSEGFRNGRVAA